jgi:hypothetical protein
MVARRFTPFQAGDSQMHALGLLDPTAAANFIPPGALACFH